MMKFTLLLASSLVLVGANANAQSYPMVDKVAAKIVQKYQTSTCQQLAQERQAPPDADKEAKKDRVGEMLRSDPKMRAALVSQVAAPVADKMIACGFIP